MCGDNVKEVDRPANDLRVRIDRLEGLTLPTGPQEPELILVTPAPKTADTRVRKPHTDFGGPVIAQLLRRDIGEREVRARFFPEASCDGGMWNILIDLAVQKLFQRSISVSSACIASRSPPNTALRYIELLVEMGLIERLQDPSDRRRYFVDLGKKAYLAICGYVEAKIRLHVEMPV